jgi:regulatory protein
VGAVAKAGKESALKDSDLKDSGMTAVLTRGKLRTRAEWYLLRYPASSANVERFLQRTALRLEPDSQVAAAAPLIADVMADLRRNGMLNDATFAEHRARSLLQRGQPPRRIAASLRARQVPEEAIAAALASLGSGPQYNLGHDPDAQEFIAACQLVRRRRLGPCRSDANLREDQRLRDMAVLARAGFSHAAARRALALPDGEAVAAVLRGEEGIAD